MPSPNSILGILLTWGRCDNIQSMTMRVGELREQFKIDDQFHKRVYLFTYAFARPEGQRALRTSPFSAFSVGLM